MDTELGEVVLLGMLRQFGVNDCLSVRKNAFALANDSYHVSTVSNSRYVLRVLRTQTPANATNEYVIQKALANVGIQAPLYLPTLDGDIVGSEGDLYFTLSREIAGRRPERLTIALSRSIGVTLGLMHSALDPATVLVAFDAAQWLHPTNVESALALCSTDRRRQLGQLLMKGSQLFEKNLPKALIHADLKLDNVFAEGETVTAVFDFETAAYSYRILDVARSFLSLAHEDSLADEEILRVLWCGYDEGAHSPITPTEKAAFPVALTFVTAACAAWLCVNGGAQFVDPYLAVLDRWNAAARL